MKAGKSTRQNRGSESSGCARVGVARGIARLADAEERRRRHRSLRHATTVSPANSDQVAGGFEVSRGGARRVDGDQYQFVSDPTVSWSTPAQAARAASQSPPTRSERRARSDPRDLRHGQRRADSPVCCQRTSGYKQEHRGRDREPADAGRRRPRCRRRARQRRQQREAERTVSEREAGDDAAPDERDFARRAGRRPRRARGRALRRTPPAGKGRREDGQEQHARPAPAARRRGGCRAEPVEQLERDSVDARETMTPARHVVTTGAARPIDSEQRSGYSG